jgi:CAAX prenyl protease-like protein
MPEQYQEIALLPEFSPRPEIYSTEANAALYQGLASLPLWAMVGWGVFRILGFWVLAPILEELVFRSYLISRLSDQEIANNRKIKFSLLALIVTSVLLGFLHNAWIAGTIAGVLFELVRYRSESITNPIIAHSTANVLVAAWAVQPGNWSLI